jgi:cyclopropane fatty-acyl-phospholipid synthase-like methyltransferase
MRLRGWFFDLQYLLRRTPWDTKITPPEVVALVEGEILPPGRTLDLGCGTGTNSIYLAHRGWETVGVDFSAVAIRRARRKARRAKVDCRFYQADVTHLSFLKDNGPFDLTLDIGCLHSIPEENWTRYATGVAQLARPGGLYMLYAFTTCSDHPSPRGVTPDQVRSLFDPAFTVERQEGGNDPTGPRSAWYWLRRTTCELA